jgi:hypothetical protein
MSPLKWFGPLPAALGYLLALALLGAAAWHFLCDGIAWDSPGRTPQMQAMALCASLPAGLGLPAAYRVLGPAAWRAVLEPFVISLALFLLVTGDVLAAAGLHALPLAFGLVAGLGLRRFLTEWRPVVS